VGVKRAIVGLLAPFDPVGYQRTMLVEHFPVGPLGCNCSIVADDVAKKAIVIDPGGDFERIRRRLDHHGLTVTAIVHTHTHVDHVGATAPLQNHCCAAAHIHESDRFLYDMLPVQARLLGLPLPPICDMQGTLRDDFSLRAGALELCVLHTPGHTPGSVCFTIAHGDERWAFTGDTLFRGSIGRTDLWGGDHAALRRSLVERLVPLPEETTVVPGHGALTTIAQERRLNPFLRE
jgi:glyoxylase-like metal-dependent hydrolase (beta-lactamase superfamily II)